MKEETSAQPLAPRVFILNGCCNCCCKLEGEGAGIGEGPGGDVREVRRQRSWQRELKSDIAERVSVRS